VRCAYLTGNTDDPVRKPFTSNIDDWRVTVLAGEPRYRAHSGSGLCRSAV